MPIFQQPSTRQAMQEGLVSAAATMSIFLRRDVYETKEKVVVGKTKVEDVAKKTDQKSNEIISNKKSVLVLVHVVTVTNQGKVELRLKINGGRQLFQIASMDIFKLKTLKINERGSIWHKWKSKPIWLRGLKLSNTTPNKVVCKDMKIMGSVWKYNNLVNGLLGNAKSDNMFFGDYEVLYVKYPGFPPSPPMPSTNGVNGKPYGPSNNGRDIKPLGVDVSNHRRNNKLSGGVIYIISLSAAVVTALVFVAVSVLLIKRRDGAHSGPNITSTLSCITKSSGVGASMIGSGPDSASLSFRSIIHYKGSAKAFSLCDMEKETDKFNELGVLGEGGFGLGFISDAEEIELQLQQRRIIERKVQLLAERKEVRRTQALQRASRKRRGGSHSLIVHLLVHVLDSSALNRDCFTFGEYCCGLHCLNKALAFVFDTFD